MNVHDEMSKQYVKFKDKQAREDAKRFNQTLKKLRKETKDVEAMNLNIEGLFIRLPNRLEELKKEGEALSSRLSMLCGFARIFRHFFLKYLNKRFYFWCHIAIMRTSALDYFPMPFQSVVGFLRLFFPPNEENHGFSLSNSLHIGANTMM